MALAVEDNPPELFIPAAVPLTTDDTAAAVAVAAEYKATARRWAGSKTKGGAPRIFGPCPWAVAMTGHQKEKAVARALMALEIPYFLPMELIRYPGSSKITCRIVFEGTIFFQADAAPTSRDYIIGGKTKTEADVRRLNHVYGLIRTGHQVQLKQEMAVLAFEDAANRTFRRLLPEETVPGMNVEVVDGPFAGYQGSIDADSFQHDPLTTTLFINMDFMGTLSCVEVPTKWLVAI